MDSDSHILGGDVSFLSDQFMHDIRQCSDSAILWDIEKQLNDQNNIQNYRLYYEVIMKIASLDCYKDTIPHDLWTKTLYYLGTYRACCSQDQERKLQDILFKYRAPLRKIIKN